MELHKICEEYELNGHFPTLLDDETYWTFLFLKDLTDPNKWTEARLEAEFYKYYLQWIQISVKSQFKDELPELWDQIEFLLKVENHFNPFGSSENNPIIITDDSPIQKKRACTQVAPQLPPTLSFFSDDDDDFEDPQPPKVVRKRPLFPDDDDDFEN